MRTSAILAARERCAALMEQVGVVALEEKWEAAMPEDTMGLFCHLTNPLPPGLQQLPIDALILQWAALGGLSVQGKLALNVEKVLWSFAAPSSPSYCAASTSRRNRNPTGTQAPIAAPNARPP